ncbi:hypothetical protein ACLKA6_014891 [Drosophila palustris]
MSADWRIAKSTVTPDRLQWAIGTFQPYKSPGLDMILPSFLQQGQDILLPMLRKIMISSLALGYIPNAWRRARVVFIPKAGKKDITSPKSFRPISLTSFLLKTLEKLVDHKIRSTLLVQSPLQPTQHAYRAGRSTDTALYQLHRTLSTVVDNKEVAICAFLDIEGAFDNTSHDAVKAALSRRGLDTML